MAIVAGNLRHIITIKQPIVTKDAYGAEKQTWLDFLILRAGVKYITGSKGVNNNEVFTVYGVEFTTYFRGGILPTYIIVFDGKKFKINNIQEIGYKEGLLISTELINE
jgi:head-tail adaptor